MGYGDGGGMDGWIEGSMGFPACRYRDIERVNEEEIGRQREKESGGNDCIFFFLLSSFSSISYIRLIILFFSHMLCKYVISFNAIVSLAVAVDVSGEKV